MSRHGVTAAQTTHYCALRMFALGTVFFATTFTGLVRLGEAADETLRLVSGRHHGKPIVYLPRPHTAFTAVSPYESANGAGVDEPFTDAGSVPQSFDAPPVSERSKTIFLWNGAKTDEGEDDPPIMTDRPDFTEASSTVGRGVFQIETGYTFFHDKHEGVTVQSHSWGEALFRYGVLEDWLELRLGLFPLSEHTTHQDPAVGVGDLYLGVKLALTEQAGWLPEMALTPQMFVPTGSSQFTGGEVLPGINWLYGWDVTEWMSTAGSTQINKVIGDEEDGHIVFAQSWTVGYTLTEKLGAYTEWFAFFPCGSQSALPEHYFNGGFTYKFTKDLQWDIRAGAGLNEAAADFFAGTGLSVRFR